MQVVKDRVRERACNRRLTHPPDAITPRISQSHLESLQGISGLQSSDGISESKKKKKIPCLQTSIPVI